MVTEAGRRAPRLPWMVAFLGRRLVWAIITLFIYLTVVFFFVQWWVPHDFATQFGLGGSAEEAATRLGLDRPLPERYVEYMGGLLTADFGESLTGQPVWDIIRGAAPVTLLVFAVGAVIAYVMGEALGRVTAWRRGTAAGWALSVLGVISATIFPPFLVFVLVRYLRSPMLTVRDALGLPTDSMVIWQESRTEPDQVLLLVALALLASVVGGLVVRAYAHRHRLRWLSLVALPVCLGAAFVAVFLAGVGWEAVDLLYRVDFTTSIGSGSPILVLVAVVLISFGQVLFMMRVGMEDESQEDYVLTARAKGLTEREVRDVHVTRNALIPTLAASFLALPTLLAGMIIVEFELEVHGLSWAFFEAVEFQDIPTMMGVLVVLGLLGVALRVTTDFVIAHLDPRQRRASV